MNLRHSIVWHINWRMVTETGGKFGAKERKRGWVDHLIVRESNAVYGND